MPISMERVAAIKRLQGLIYDQTVDLIERDSRFALLDFPDHDNIGDSAIYVGELAFLSSKGLRPSYVATTTSINWDAMADQIGSGPILLHGGGNFGDLWPWFQPFREEILLRFPGRSIVQFPQTVFYKEQSNLDHTARLIERHGAFTLLVRDQRSFDVATKSFQCDIRLCPDMAYFAGPAKRGPPTHDLLLHLRNDQEAAESHELGDLATDPGVLQSDWPEEAADFRARDQRRRKFSLALALARGGRHSYLEARYRGLAETRLARGFDLLSRGRMVITDRLHGHIMSYLLDLPHCVLDNSYGKISGFIETWSTVSGNVSRAGSMGEAGTWYRHALGHGPEIYGTAPRVRQSG